MNIACIIPARGGSKGIPGKNIKSLAGKPLICWSIQQALESKLINRGVYVSSDSQDILTVAEQAGATAIKRPDELSSDSASSESALVHAIDTIRAQSDIDLIVFLQCTSPIRKRDDIDNAITTLQQQQADSLLSVLTIKDYFVWQAGSNEQSASSVNFDYQNRKRRQDLPTQYLENGSIYVFKPEILEQYNNRLGGKIALYPMEKYCSQQIDDEAEFMLCDAILRGLSEESGVAL
ncbi:acylneuraminate cytidylyltransferase family protein [Paraneptunicella aestuarii]|uniref:acylneuraminate cytidylyltransferase family protein n=1 Tax=Paraneptunicella aestuarii TaxID=2831148 RepID=UPI001E4CC044|nr:acylneuraminate cytidylyltransferase family protein [Paraneptunicella aestuarii]UAA39542.1 acylneuraminate cytidylyltransferase family protein [Paraneptunicella aestuarii]